MDKINSNYSQIAYRASYQEQLQRAKQNAKENSGDIAAGGAVSTAAFTTLKNSSKIGNRAVKLVQDSKTLQATRKNQIIKILSKGKFMNSPIIKKIAGPLAAFSAFSTVTGSALKIADTCQYLGEQKQIANA